MRSVTHRNISGAFLGGFAGILVAGLVHPWLLPVGCLTGVALGFWYDQIGAAVRSAWEAVAWWFGDQLDNFLEARPHRWFPVEVARRSAIVAYVAIQLTVWGGLWLPQLIGAANSRASAYFPLLLFGGFLGIILACTCVLELSHVGRRRFGRRRWYFKQYREYQRVGWLALFVQLLLTPFLPFLALAAAGALWVVVAVPLGVLYATFYLLVGGLVYLTLKLARGLSIRGAYWTCLLTTLAVTAVSGYLFRNDLHGPLLWLLALGTGLVSGVVAEAVRRAIVAVFDNWPGLTKFLDEGFKRLLLDQGRRFGRAAATVSRVPLQFLPSY